MENTTDVTKTLITYDGDAIASVVSGGTATLRCAGKKMKTDITVKAADGEVVEEYDGHIDNNIVGTWTFNDEVSFDGLSPNTSYAVSFNYSGPNGPFKYMQTDGNASGSQLYLRFGTSTGSQAVYYWKYDDPRYSGWQRDGWSRSYKTITISEQPTDETIVKWIKANAKRQGETSTPNTTVTYDGEVIASLAVGQTDTIPCAGKKMTSDLIITSAEPTKLKKYDRTVEVIE